MVLLTALLTAAIVRRPIPLTRAEALLAVAMPLAAGWRTGCSSSARSPAG